MKKYFKTFLCVILMFSIINIPYISSKAENVTHYKKYNSLVITGHIPEEKRSDYESRSISAQLMNGDEVLFLDEVIVEADGTYQFGIYMDKEQNLEECILSLRIGNKGAADTVVSAVASYTELVSVPAQITREDEHVNITADFSLIDVVSEDFMAIFAVYSNEGGILKQVKSLNDKSSLREKEKLTVSYKISDISEDDTIKIFVWQDRETLIPVSYLSKNEVMLGSQYMEDTEYKELTSENVYERYKAARAEVDEDVEIPQVPDIKTKHNLYVSPYGNDNNDGSMEYPYQTLTKALSVISGWSEERKREWKTIYLCEGKYNTEKDIVFDDAVCDSNGNANIIIKALDGADVVFTSSKIVQGSRFEKVTDLSETEKTRFNQNVIDNLYYCDYSDLGIEKINGFTNTSMPSVIYNGKKASISRYPNASDLYISEVVNNGINGENPVFKPSDMRCFEWENPDNKIGISGQLVYSWTSTEGLVKSINKADQTITLPNGIWTGYSTANDMIHGIGVNLHNNKLVKSHYYFYNILEELDVENEWCAEDNSKRLYYYPIDGKINADDFLYLTGQNACKSVMKVNKASNIVFDGLNFFGCEKAIDVSYSENVTVTNSDMKCVSSGLYLYNTTKCGILNSYIEDADFGVRMADSRDNIYNLKADRNFVFNVHMNGLSSSGVYMDGAVGNIVSHNLVENYQGSMVYIWRGCENIIEYNESVAGALFGDEGASIYVAGQFDSRHNHIRYNYVHHNNLEPSHKKFDQTKRTDTTYINNFIAKLNAGGLSIDDIGEAEYIYGNIFECLSIGAGSNSGNDNVFDENYYDNCIIGTNLRGQYSNNYTEDYIFYNQLTGRFRMKGDMKTSPILAGYYDPNYNLNESEAYQRRYSYLEERIDWFNHIKDIWPDSGANCEEDIYFFASETGNLVLDNKYANCIKPEFYSLLAQKYMNTDVDVKSGDKPTKYNDYSWLSYNVVYGNYVDDTAKVSDSDIYYQSGLLDFSSNVYDENNNLVKLLSAEKNDVGGLNLVWNKRSDANYYKVTLTNSEENKIMYTFDNYISTEENYDSYTIEAYTYRKDSNKEAALASS